MWCSIFNSAHEVSICGPIFWVVSWFSWLAFRGFPLTDSNNLELVTSSLPVQAVAFELRYGLRFWLEALQCSGVAGQHIVSRFLSRRGRPPDDQGRLLYRSGVSINPRLFLSAVAPVSMPPGSEQAVTLQAANRRRGGGWANRQESASCDFLSRNGRSGHSMPEKNWEGRTSCIIGIWLFCLALVCSSGIAERNFRKSGCSVFVLHARSARTIIVGRNCQSVFRGALFYPHRNNGSSGARSLKANKGDPPCCKPSGQRTVPLLSPTALAFFSGMNDEL